MIEIKTVYAPYPQIPRFKASNIVKFDDHYGLNNRDYYRFGVEVDEQLLLGQEALDFLTQQVWGENGETFLDLIPDFFRPSPTMMDPINPARSIPNPDYAADMAIYNEAKAEMLRLMHEVLKLVCKVTFPAVKDTGNLIQWFQRMGGVWYEIPVEVGKYPGVNKFVTVEEPEHPQYNGFMNFVTACNNDKLKILHVLLQLPYTAPEQSTQTGAGSTTVIPTGGGGNTGGTGVG